MILPTSPPSPPSPPPPSSSSSPSSEKNKVKKVPGDFPRVKSDLLATKEAHSEDFDSVMIYNSNFVPHLTRDVYSEGYVLDNKEACHLERQEEILLLIIVISAPEHFAHRAA